MLLSLVSTRFKNINHLPALEGSKLLSGEILWRSYSIFLVTTRKIVEAEQLMRRKPFRASMPARKRK
jgi:hypothetical protein